MLMDVFVEWIDVKFSVIPISCEYQLLNNERHDRHGGERRSQTDPGRVDKQAVRLQDPERRTETPPEPPALPGHEVRPGHLPLLPGVRGAAGAGGGADVHRLRPGGAAGASAGAAPAGPGLRGSRRAAQQEEEEEEGGDMAEDKENQSPSRQSRKRRGKASEAPDFLPSKRARLEPGEERYAAPLGSCRAGAGDSLSALSLNRVIPAF
ncbi:hypothetical protein L3Q82_005499 [Scortum barcoo]|uniref:Uncharacterized protein n=1 Tax=Scortum barcoo TaxID=214431 RepID=A0ACB8VAR1_9TELE|nr:hypothetical protein L3Q82_005499 [Scortum barcoo]